MKPGEQLSYRNFLKVTKDSTDTPIPDANELAPWFNSIQPHNSLQPAALYFLDYVQYKYLFIVPSGNDILGYTSKYLLGAGPYFVLDMLHGEDLSVINNQIFPLNLNCLARHAGKINALTFSYTYRLKAKNGRYRYVSHRSAYFGRAANGSPLATVGIISDISAFKHDPRIIYHVEHGDGGRGNYESPGVQYFYPDERQAALSRREIDVLKWVCEGLSSKQIAVKLNLSIHTINNHRKNMLEKSNCRNLSELLNYALKNGII